MTMPKKEKPVKVSEPTVQPKYDYSDKTIHELHLVINAGLLYGQEAATKMENKARLSADDKRMIQTMRTMTQAYVELANKIFHDKNNKENFVTFEDVKNHLDSKIPTYQLFGCKYDSDDEDKGHGNDENGDN